MNEANTQFFNIVAKRHKGLFLIRAYGYTNCMSSAKDVVQEAFRSIVEEVEKGTRNINSEEGLKIAILHYINFRGIDCLRKENRRSEEPIGNKNSSIHHKINGRIVKKYISDERGDYLSEEYKRLLLQANLSELQKYILEKSKKGWSVDAIAQNLGMESAKVSRQKFIAIQKLRELAKKRTHNGK